LQKPKSPAGNRAFRINRTGLAFFDEGQAGSFTERELIMASATASCKSEKAQLISSPLIGGLMEQESPVVVRIQDGTHPIPNAISDMVTYVPKTTCRTGGQA
jgi:hypothetical protein